MNSEIYTELNPDLISELDSYIKNNKPIKGNIPFLSISEMPMSITNLQKIQKIDQPSYAAAADFAGGCHHCIYYKDPNSNIYVINFYVQKFHCYYLLEDFVPQLQDYISMKNK